MTEPYPSVATPRPKVGGWWFAIVPLGLLGGLIGYFSLRSDDPARANHVMKWSLILLVPSVVLSVLMPLLLFGALASSSSSFDTDVHSTASLSQSSTTSIATDPSSPPTSAKPAAPAPGGDAPVTELGIEDLKVGDGATVKVGDTIVAHYLGASYRDGETFQASWDSGETFETVIGVGQVIKGWDDGIPGMRVGGRRQLTIPAADAYGAEDTGDGRPHGDLVFIIDVYASK